MNRWKVPQIKPCCSRHRYFYVLDKLNTTVVKRLDHRRLFKIVLLSLLVTSNGVLTAGTLAHYAPGVYNIRDFYVPDPGFYTLLYAPYYHTHQYKDSNGNTTNFVSGPARSGRLVTLALSTDIDVATINPTFMWVSPWKIPGDGKFSAYVAPSFGNSSVSSSLETASGRDVSSTHSQFAIGDLFAQPVWLGWTKSHWDLSAAYGFYAPTGKFSTDGTTLRLSGLQVTGIATNNVGLGFWENQFQGAAAWYPWEDKRTAISVAGTYEISAGQQGTGITPGSDFTMNWGISQYVPLRSNKTLLLEIGPAGYCEWQTSYDHGSGVDPDNNPLSKIYAGGGQIGLTYVPWKAFLNVLYYEEFGAVARFQGQMLSVSVGKKIF